MPEKQRAIRVSDITWAKVKAVADISDITVNEWITHAIARALAPTPVSASPAAASLPVPSVRAVPGITRPPKDRIVFVDASDRCKTCGWILVAGSCKNKCQQAARKSA